MRKLRAGDLLRLHVPIERVLPFVLLADHPPGASLDASNPATRLAPALPQAGLFDAADDSALLPPVAPRTTALRLLAEASSMGGAPTDTVELSWA